MMMTMWLFFLGAVHATRYGTPDAGRHQFAGSLFIPIDSTGFGCVARIVYGGCGGSLVDIPGFPLRRTFLTARHCIEPRTTADPFLIYFGPDNVLTRELPCRYVNGSSASAEEMFLGALAVAPSHEGPANLKEDYALILLDREVPPSIVDHPAVIFDSSALRNFAPADIAAAVGDTGKVARVGLTGYGIAGWGDELNNYLRKPLAVRGDRTKDFIVMEIKSMTPTKMTTGMVAAQLDQTACNGDSGSAALSLSKIDGAFHVYGVTTAGDRFCRATNTFTIVKFLFILFRIRISNLTFNLRRSEPSLSTPFWRALSRLSTPGPGLSPENDLAALLAGRVRRMRLLPYFFWSFSFYHYFFLLAEPWLLTTVIAMAVTVIGTHQ